MNNNLYALYEKIETKSDFEFFLKSLVADLVANKSDWENDTLHSFLEGLYGYNYRSDHQTQPTWKIFAEMLIAARVYE